MSRDREPPPHQPPIPNANVNNMAQVQRDQNRHTLQAYGEADPRLLYGRSIPSLQSAAFGSRSGYAGQNLPPMQLSPMGHSPPITTSSTRAMTISSLLSSPDPPVASDSFRRQPPRPLHARPDNRSSASSSGSSPTDVRAQPPVYGRTSSHYLDRPPGPPPGFHHPSTSSDPERVPYSPATTSQSHASSYYSGSDEPSPRTSVPFARQRSSAPLVSPVPPLNYHLVIRQQPLAARACGFGERDRRVIDPPPILQLLITDKATGSPEQDPNAMLALHCTLLSSDGNEDQVDPASAQEDMPSTRRLTGTLVASPYQAKDEYGIAGNFFVFHDMSCRSPGRYILLFKLIRIDPRMMIEGTKHPTVASVTTNIFDVYPAKDFPGMRQSSDLLKALRRQGLNVSVKKGSDARKKGKAKKESESEEEGDESEDDRRGSNVTGETASSAGVSPKTKLKKKGRSRN